MPDRFSEIYIGPLLGGKFVFEGDFDGIAFEFNFDGIVIHEILWVDLKGRGKSLSTQQLNEVRDVCNDRLLDLNIDLLSCVADIFNEMLNDGFKFDDKAEIMFGDN